jgi:Protein of unknown function (DUF998)
VTTRTLAFVGLTGPGVFAMLVFLVTALEWDFLHALGWSAAPLDSPDPPWPSSAALGDWGFLLVLAFLVLGASILALAGALFRLLDPRRKLGPIVLALAGAGACIAAFRTDYGSAGAGGPETWNGTLHAVGLTIFVPLMTLSMFVLAAQFRRSQSWRPMSRQSLIAGLVALASFVAFIALQCSVFFWIFLAVVLIWLTLTSTRAVLLSA